MEPENIPPTPLPVPGKGRNVLLKVAALAVVAFGLPFVLDAIFTPWTYFMGGHFHINRKWTGWGRMHSNTSGDYVIYMTISSWFGRGHSLTDIAGNGALCTQRGDNYRLSMAGSFQEGWGTDLQGRTATIYPHNYNPKLTGHNDPSLEFRGKWNNPDLVLDDQGTINRAFDPGGALVKNPHMRPNAQEVVPLTLHEGSRSDFDAACAAIKRK
jgi:hypothetical protein